MTRSNYAGVTRERIRAPTQKGFSTLRQKGGETKSRTPTQTKEEATRGEHEKNTAKVGPQICSTKGQTGDG